MSTDGMDTRTRSFNCCAARTCTSGGRPKGNILGGETTRIGKRSAKVLTFLEAARVAQVVAMQERRKQQRVLIFQGQTAWMTQHGNIDDFVPSWERPENVELAPLAQEVLEVTHCEKIWHERY